MYDNWVVVFRSGIDYEADIVRDRLADSGIPAVVLSKRDHAYNLFFGDLAKVLVMVPADKETEAQSLLDAEPVSDAELEAAALASTVDPEAAGPEDPFDSGSESIRLSVPDNDPDKE